MFLLLLGCVQQVRHRVDRSWRGGRVLHGPEQRQPHLRDMEEEGTGRVQTVRLQEGEIYFILFASFVETLESSISRQIEIEI